MTLQIKAEVLLNNSNWERNLKKTSKQMEGFGKSMKTISRGIQAGLAAIGINAVGDALMDATKAADQDAKSIRLLNKVLENSWKATTEQTKAVDDFIQKTSLQVGILDDELRPAFAKIATTTRNPEKAMKRFRIALDTAAGSGKDLNAVSMAMAKFFGGNEKALDKLIPGIKDVDDKMGFLQKKFGGAAEAGVGAFDKINVAMENAKESIGAKLLPEIEKFAKWLGSPEGMKAMDQWISDLKMLIGLASDFLGLVRNVAGIFDQKQKDKALTSAAGAKNGLNYLGGGQTKFMTTPTAMPGSASTTPNITINVTGNPFDGYKVVKALKNTAQTRGVPLAQLLR